MTYVKNTGRMQDDSLVLNDTVAAITASALGSVGGSAAAGIIDLGNTPAAFDVVIDVEAVKVTAGDEEYRHQIIGSTASDFSSGVALLGELRMGALEVLTTAVSSGDVDVDSPVGRYILTCRNYSGDGTVYRYVRYVYHEEAGTAPSWTPASDIYIAQVRNA